MQDGQSEQPGAALSVARSKEGGRIRPHVCLVRGRDVLVTETGSFILVTLGTGELEWRKGMRVSSAHFHVSENRLPAQSSSGPCGVLSRLKNTWAGPLARGPGCSQASDGRSALLSPCVCRMPQPRGSPGERPSRCGCFAHAGARDLRGAGASAAEPAPAPGLPASVAACPAAPDSQVLGSGLRRGRLGRLAISYMHVST